MFSPFMYFKNNKKKATIILVILALAVFCIAYVVTLIDSVYTTSKEANTSPFQNLSLVSYIGRNLDENKGRLISELDDQIVIYDVYISSASIKTVLGTTSAYLLFLPDRETMDEVMKKCHVTMDTGEKPEDHVKQLILHESILKNKELKVGDEVNDIKIVGSFHGDITVGFGCMDDAMKDAFRYQSPGYILMPEDGSSQKLTDLNQKLRKLDKKEWQIATYQSQLKKLDEEFETTNLIMMIVVIMMAISLSIAISAFLFSIYSARYNEFAILNAIGYKLSSIKGVILLEVLFVSALSWVIGYGLSLAALHLTNILIYEDMGQKMQLFNPNSIGYTMLLPLISVIFTLVPIIRKLSKTDLISIIEGR